MKLPPNTIKVAPENLCDVCKKEKALYYNLTYYMHICSIKCFEDFVRGYNKEIDEIAIKKLDPDEMDKLKRGKDV